MVIEAAFPEKMEVFVRDQFRDISRIRAEDLDSVELLPLLRAINPYHWRARGVASVFDLVKELVDLEDSRFEAYLFHELIRSVSFMVAQERFGAMRSASLGIDFEFERENVRYYVVVAKDESSLDEIRYPDLLAERGGDDNRHQPTLGIYFGRSETSYDEDNVVLIVRERNYWELISGEREFHQGLFHLFGGCTRDMLGQAEQSRARALNRLSRDFVRGFCFKDGSMDWSKIMTLVSKSA